MNTSVKTLIGVSGLPRSGKDTVADALMAHGYYGVSLGDIVRDFARIRHADKSDPISIANMTDTSNWLRTEKGPDFALKEALERFETAKKENDYVGLVVYSVRAPIEVDFILAHNGEIIWVEASDDIRFERNKRAKREGEPDITKEEFLRQEALQWTPQPDLPKEVQMDIEYVKLHATIAIPNEGNDIPAFIQTALKILDIA